MLGDCLRQAVKTSYALFRIIVPIAIGVRLLELLGAIDLLGRLLAPLMALVGLPGSMGLVWATTLVTNLYGGMVVFAGVAPGAGLTVAQVTVLATMMLIAHAIPVEASIAQQAGTRFRTMAALRVAGALLAGMLLNLGYTVDRHPAAAQSGLVESAAARPELAAAGRWARRATWPTSF